LLFSIFIAFIKSMNLHVYLFFVNQHFIAYV